MLEPCLDSLVEELRRRQMKLRNCVTASCLFKTIYRSFFIILPGNIC